MMSPHDLLQLKSSCSIYNIIRIKDTNTPPHCRFHPAETPRQSSAKPLEITAGVEMFRFKKKKKKKKKTPIAPIPHQQKAYFEIPIEPMKIKDIVRSNRASIEITHNGSECSVIPEQVTAVSSRALKRNIHRSRTRESWRLKMKN